MTVSEADRSRPRDDARGPSTALLATPWAWGVCWLMFASTVLNYMDRQAISLVSTEIKGEFHLTNTEFGWVMAVFSLTYALCQLPAGLVVDRWDLRRTYAGAVAWWSLAGMAAAFSPTIGALLVFRALLGVGESFNWPCALRVTARILPPADRSLGNGIFNSGAAIGAVLTPLTVPLLTKYFGWRTSFFVIGALGFVWVAAWQFVLRGPGAARLLPEAAPPSPSDSPSAGLTPLARMVLGAVVATSLAIAALVFRVGLPALWVAIAWLMCGSLIAAFFLPEAELKGAPWAAGFGLVAKNRRFLVLVLVSVSINVCWHFLVSWMPAYLRDDRGMQILVSGLWVAVPFVAADLGNLGGGALSRFFAARGRTTVRARILVMAFCTLLISTGAWVGLAESDALVIVLLATMALGTAAFMANYFAFTQEVAPRHTGLVVGILGGLGNLYAAGFLPFAGMVKDRTGGFGPIFVLVGLLPFVGLAALHFGWGDDPAEPVAPLAP